MERRLERLGVNLGAGRQAADQVGESIASALTSIAERFRGGASVAGDEAARIGNEAAELGNEACAASRAKSSVAPSSSWRLLRGRNSRRLGRPPR